MEPAKPLHIRLLPYAACLFPALLLLATNNSIFVIGDDKSTVSLLHSGQTRNGLISYPLSVILAALYRFFPDLPWYSGLLSLLVMCVGAALIACLAEMFPQHLFYRVSGYFLTTTMITEFTLNMSMTTLTMALAGSGLTYFVVRGRVGLLGATALVTASVLLRIELWVIMLPFYAAFVIAGSLLPRPATFEPVQLKSYLISSILLLMPALIVIGIHKQSFLEEPYKTWADYNRARGLIIDFNVDPDISDKRFWPIETTAEDIEIFRNWQVYDEQVFPTAALINTTPGRWDVMLKNIFNSKFPNRLKDRFYGWIAAAGGSNTGSWQFLIGMVLGVASAFLIAAGRSEIRRKLFWIVAGNLGLFFWMLIIASARDVRRVSLGFHLCFLLFNLVLYAAALHTGRLKPNSGRWKAAGTLLGLIFCAAAVYGIRPSIESSYREMADGKRTLAAAEREFRELSAAAPDRPLLISLHLPSGRQSGFLIGFQNLRENSFVGDYSVHPFLPAGWLVRHPFYYQKLKQFGSDSYYQLLMDPRSLWIGGGRANLELQNKWLRYLDRHFPVPGQHYQLREIYRSGDSVLTKLYLKGDSDNGT